MARAWKSYWGVDMGGLLIDTLAYRFLSEWSNNEKSFHYYDWMSRDFFKFLSEQREDRKYWFAPGSNQQVYKRGNFIYSASLCYQKACEAIDYYEKEYYFSAKSRWREIYGTQFPS